MAFPLKTITPFPIFAPIPTTTTVTITTAPTTTEIRFSRWNNANADKFLRHRRTQHQIEEELRRIRRFDSAANIASSFDPNSDPTLNPNPNPNFRSTGTPSTPSRSSIPGKKSKYSKHPNPNPRPNSEHPAFRKLQNNTNLTPNQAGEKYSRNPNPNPNFEHPAFRRVQKKNLPQNEEDGEFAGDFDVNVGEDGWSNYSINPNPNSYPNSEHPAFRRVQKNTNFPQNKTGEKYSRNPNFNPNPNSEHPAFRKVHKKTKLPPESSEFSGEVDMKIGEDGLSYVVPGAPFEFRYSYTEGPKVKPLALREPPVVPFGLDRPWTGRKPFPPSKKKLPEFDSFVLPPANKKGVKPVQKPGPFLPGSGPKYAMSREEVLGEELTREEVKELVESCRKSDRQLNIGRDGLTHNMLDNIHAHWKRRRVCKIKCKGVCTVDMDNVCQQLEEKSGGKIIYRKGGVVYLFRGRNYNYRTRPRFPLMLWKPVAPVYPRLIARVPEGLTLEEATDMRKRGRQLTPICKLGKNGVYVNLAKHVREAFEACELVRIDCQGLNPSDYRKIGGKLKDLVPCVLISFENEHILMWRGPDWKPSILVPETDTPASVSSDNAHLFASDDDEEEEDDDEDEDEDENEDINEDEDVDEGESATSTSSIPIEGTTSVVEMPNASTVLTNTSANHSDEDIDSFSDDNQEEPPSVATESDDSRLGENETSQESTPSVSTERVLELLRQAVESGTAVVLDDDSYLDADVVFQKSVAFAQIAPPGPVFRYRPPRKVAIQKPVKQQSNEPAVVGSSETEREPVSEKRPREKKAKERKNLKPRIVPPKGEDFKDEYLNLVPQGSLKVDELAKLLA